MSSFFFSSLPETLISLGLSAAFGASTFYGGGAGAAGAAGAGAGAAGAAGAASAGAAAGASSSACVVMTNTDSNSTFKSLY